MYKNYGITFFRALIRKIFDKEKIIDLNILGIFLMESDLDLELWNVQMDQSKKFIKNLKI